MSKEPTRAERRDHWRAAIREYEASGLSARALCKERKIAYQSFLAWRRRFAALGALAFCVALSGLRECGGRRPSPPPACAASCSGELRTGLCAVRGRPFRASGGDGGMRGGSGRIHRPVWFRPGGA